MGGRSDRNRMRDAIDAFRTGSALREKSYGLPITAPPGTRLMSGRVAD